MNEQDVKRAKRFNYIVFALLCALILAAAACVVWLQNWPIDPSLEPETLRQAVDGAFLALVGDSCYELEAGDIDAALFGFESWVQIDSPQAGGYILTLKMGDQYELAFYEGGFAQAFNGYSRKYHLSTAWYTVPADVACAVAERIMTCGTLREPAGNWFIINK